MTPPPFRHIAGIAKHGNDADLLALRDEIRWLANWAIDLHDEIGAVWSAANVCISPTFWDKDVDAEVREVNLHLKLTQREVDTLLALLNPQPPEEHS